LLAAIALLAACRSSGGGGSRTVTVNTFAGDQPEPGVTVIGHAPNGEVIDQTNADAVGLASVGVDDDSLVTAIFPGNLGALTPVISVITVPAPDAEVSIHGPTRNNAPPLIVGALQVDGPNLNTADYFDIRIGCATTRVTRLPADMDVGACSMGTDTKLDVLVAGYHDVSGTSVLDGYGTGRVTMTNGLASLNVPAWQTTRASVPITLDGVAPLVEVELLSDGLSFGREQAIDRALLWTGLVVDASRITASLAGIDAARITTREATGAPTAIAFDTTNFLPPVSKSAALETLDPATITWDANPIGDAVNLRATWEAGGGVRGAPAVPTGPHRVIWDAVLPPDATRATLPALDGELASAIAPTTIMPVDVVLRYIDSAAYSDFAGLYAVGIYAGDTLQASTIAPRPPDGELRVSHAIGLR